ncbi:hypothetical protein K2P56_00450 [Patescibacteria group bacterium]|nr:hypothetical protein [Patescibacteria group bacterium]
MDKKFMLLAAGGAALALSACEQSPINAGTSQFCGAVGAERNIADKAGDAAEIAAFAVGQSEGGAFQTPPTVAQLAARTTTCEAGDFQAAYALARGEYGYAGDIQIAQVFRSRFPEEVARAQEAAREAE